MASNLTPENLSRSASNNSRRRSSVLHSAGRTLSQMEREESGAKVHSNGENARYTKDGIESTVVDASQLRLLVHCPGCPPFIAVVPQASTIAELQKEVGAIPQLLVAGL